MLCKYIQDIKSKYAAIPENYIKIISILIRCVILVVSAWLTFYSADSLWRYINETSRPSEFRQYFPEKSLAFARSELYTIVILLPTIVMLGMSFMVAYRYKTMLSMWLLVWISPFQVISISLEGNAQDSLNIFVGFWVMYLSALMVHRLRPVININICLMLSFLFSLLAKLHIYLHHDPHIDSLSTIVYYQGVHLLYMVFFVLILYVLYYSASGKTDKTINGSI